MLTMTIHIRTPIIIFHKRGDKHSCLESSSLKKLLKKFQQINGPELTLKLVLCLEEVLSKYYHERLITDRGNVGIHQTNNTGSQKPVIVSCQTKIDFEITISQDSVQPGWASLLLPITP